MEQCVRLNEAAVKYGLPEAPLDDAARKAAVVEARQEAAEIFAATSDELDQIIPPLDVMLP